MNSLIFLLGTLEKLILTFVVAILIIYFLFVYFAVTSCFKFRKRLLNSRNTLKLLLTEKLTLVNSLYQVALDNNLKYSLDVILSGVEEKIKNNKLKGLYSKIDQAYYEIYRLLKNGLSDEDKQNLIIDNYKLNEENDYIYRQTIDSYNTDLLGYNYRCKLIITRPFTLLFKFKPMEQLL